MALRPFLSKGVPFSNVRPSWHSDFRGVNFGIQSYPVAYSGAIEAIEDDAILEEAGQILLDLIGLSLQIAQLEEVPGTPEVGDAGPVSSQTATVEAAPVDG